MNLKIREFKISIEQYIESTEIPWEVKRMVLKDIFESVSQKADKMILQEIEERDKEESENGNAESA